VGRLDAGGTILNCFNNASVSVTGNTVGGIVGYTYGATGPIIACYNTGAIQGDTYVGGILGYNGSGVSITACYNTGAITSIRASGHTYMGGISGNSGTMMACYNTGEVKNSVSNNIGPSIGGGTKTACYAVASTNLGGATQFSGSAWPSTSAHAQWGVGDGNGDGKYWKSLGSWNNGNPTYPKLFFEQ
jgi:hypothetical protein